MEETKRDRMMREDRTGQTEVLRKVGKTRKRKRGKDF